jgi:hypothetical protein
MSFRHRKTGRMIPLIPGRRSLDLKTVAAPRHRPPLTGVVKGIQRNRVGARTWAVEASAGFRLAAASECHALVQRTKRATRAGGCSAPSDIFRALTGLPGTMPSLRGAACSALRAWERPPILDRTGLERPGSASVGQQRAAERYSGPIAAGLDPGLPAPSPGLGGRKAKLCIWQNGELC